jgi:GNAT superfamily N-acetyltransferase
MFVRKLSPWEWDELRAHLLRLAAEERRWRFCRRMDDAAIDAYCDRIDRLRTTVLGCFIDGTLRAVAELIQIPQEWPMSAEIALSVEKPFQRQGIGARLLGQALLVARNRMIRTVHLVSLSDNEPMQHLARKFGASTETYLTSTEGQIGLPWPSYLSLLEELAADGQGLIGAAFELHAERKAG